MLFPQTKGIICFITMHLQRTYYIQYINLFLFTIKIFQKCDFQRLLTALHVPEWYVCHQRTKWQGAEALLILLRRLAYPNRWCELSQMFGRAEPELSMICNKVLKYAIRACRFYFFGGSQSPNETRPCQDSWNSTH